MLDESSDHKDRTEDTVSQHDMSSARSELSAPSSGLHRKKTDHGNLDREVAVRRVSETPIPKVPKHNSEEFIVRG